MFKATQHFLDCILLTGHTPSKFKEALIVVIYKKGSRLDCKSYRPISFLSQAYKLLILIIAARVKPDLYESFSSTQAAYQSTRGTIEQILALEQIIEKSIMNSTTQSISLLSTSKKRLRA